MLSGRIVRLNVTCGASTGCLLFKALGSVICKCIVTFQLSSTLIGEFESNIVRQESCSQWGPLLYCFWKMFRRIVPISEGLYQFVVVKKDHILEVIN